MQNTVQDKDKDVGVKVQHEELLTSDLTCLGCKHRGALEDQSHVIVCQAYEDLRIGLDFSQDTNLVTYFQRVMLARDRMKNSN